MNIIAIDLGTTNIKVAIYDRALTVLTSLSKTVHYHRENSFVEFDAADYFDDIKEMIDRAAAAGKKQNNQNVAQIVLTGQAESLIVLDEENSPARPAISWLDMRSKKECEELTKVFPAEYSYRITGQPEIIPTWPVTKMLWLKRNEPDTFNRAAHYLLLKDYIIFRLCGRMAGDYSIYSFSCYFDIINKTWWREMLDYCGIRQTQLPEVLPPCTIAGQLQHSLVNPTRGLTEETRINVGTLDHFAGMIGTGNIKEGIISESAGTVLSLATFVSKPDFSRCRLPINCGPFPDSYVLLPVCESGGFSLEWYKNNFMPDKTFEELNDAIVDQKSVTPPIFLPYLTGVNAPDFNENASGVFFGINASHGQGSFALAIMQGIACLLRKNIAAMREAGVNVEKIISVGGGARSPLWTQIKSDFTHHPFEIPENEEAACLGAAIIAAVSEGFSPSFESAVADNVKIKQTYIPEKREHNEATWRVFNALYKSLEQVYLLNSKIR